MSTPATAPWPAPHSQPRAASHPRPASHAGPGGINDALFTSLDVEWRRTARSALAARHVEAWGLCEPVLAAHAGLASVVAAVTWDGYRPRGPSAEVLGALLRLAADALAARTLLQALVPRLRAEKVLSPRFGHGVGEQAVSPADTMADLVSESWAAIRRHAGQDHPDVARLVVQEATRKLRTARQAQRRYQQRNTQWEPGLAARCSQDLGAARSGAEWLAVALCDAVRSKALSAAQARLVYATRVQGLTVSEAARTQGYGLKAVYHALARAEQAFVSRAA
jgi:hypothetical protein